MKKVSKPLGKRHGLNKFQENKVQRVREVIKNWQMSNACLQFFCPGNKDLSVQRLLDSRRNKMLSRKKRARVAPSSLHPCFKTKQCLPKELAAGPWQVVETALQLAQKEKTQTFSFGEQRDYSAHHLLKEKGPPCQPTKLSFCKSQASPSLSNSHFCSCCLKADGCTAPNLVPSATCSF